MKKSAIRVAAVGAAAALIATMAPLSAFAATAPAWDSTSDGPVYLMDGTTATQVAAGTQLDWNYGNTIVLTAAPVPADLSDLGPLTFPAPTGGANDYIAFVAPVGSERTKSAWKEWGDSNALGGVGALLPSVYPGYLGNGTPAAVKAAGGTYSMGIAYMTNNDLTVVKAYYTTINVDAGTGIWAFASPAAAVVKVDTTTALSAPATAGSGTTVTLTATITKASGSGTPSGNVEFKDGSTSLGTVASAAGVATLPTNALTVGSHSITAVYAGDTNFNGSTSAASTVVVNDAQAGPDEALLVAGNANGFTASITGTTATITAGAANNGKSVNVFGYSTPAFLGQGTISGGAVSASVASLAAGPHKLAVVDASDATTILGWVSVTIATQGGTATRDLQAQVATSVDGNFKLIAPDNTTPAVIGNPTLDAAGQSVSTGQLGDFTVVDDRGLTKKGWDLSTNVAQFVNGSDTVANTALGVAPAIVSNSGPGTPVLGSAQIAGSATYASEFAHLNQGSYAPASVFNAGLTFKAPIGTKAGTYTSTLTLTLVSK